MKLNEQEVLGHFQDRLDQFLESSSVQQWRSETTTLYSAIAGHQWNQSDVDERNIKNKPMTTANRMAPIIKAIAGYEVMNRTKAVVVPRRDNSPEGEEKEIDVMSDAVEYLSDEAYFPFESSQASEDMLTCGVGVTHTYFDYSNPQAPQGEMVVDRIFPALALYDNTCTKRNFKGANWAGYVEVVNKDWLDDELTSIKGEGWREQIGTSQKRNLTEFLYFVENMTTDDVDLLFHYEWMELEKTKTFKNFLISAADDNDIMILAAEFEEANGVDMAEPYLTMNDSEMRKFKEMLKAHLEAGGIDYAQMIEPSKGERRKYFKARVARGVVLDATESWANDFSIQYKTGYFDEILRHFYGLGRAMLPVQILINKWLSDYDSYLESVPKGGMYMENDAVDDAIAFKDTRANEQNITLLARGGLGKIQEKSVPQAAGGLTDALMHVNQLLTTVCGLPPEFLSATMSGNMTEGLFAQMNKQAYMVLVHFFEANKVYLRRQTQLFIDGVRIISENYDGILLDKVTGSGEIENFSLSKETLTRDYTTKVVERTLTEDEKVDQFRQLAELSQVLLNKPQPVDITPLLVDQWPYELEDKEAVMQAMQPPPPPEPPQPDPVMQALLQAETQEKIAQAELNTAKAQAEMAAIQQGQQPTLKTTEKITRGSGGGIEKVETTKEQES